MINLGKILSCHKVYDSHLPVSKGKQKHGYGNRFGVKDMMMPHYKTKVPIPPLTADGGGSTKKRRVVVDETTDIANPTNLAVTCEEQTVDDELQEQQGKENIEQTVVVYAEVDRE